MTMTEHDLFYYAQRVVEHVHLEPGDDTIRGMIPTHGKQFLIANVYYDKDLPDNTSLAAALTELAWYVSQHSAEVEAQPVVSEPKVTGGNPSGRKAPKEIFKSRQKMERG